MDTSELKILHLSDLHICDKSEEQDKKFNSLVEIINEQNNKKPFDYIFISGDIINCGKTHLYKLAFNYLNKLIDNLKIKRNKIFIVPGNHDNDFEVHKNEENNLRNNLKEATFDKIQDIENKNKNILLKIKKRQEKFIKFLNELNINPEFPQYFIEGDKCIICINSSIFSDIHEHRNQIYFISEQFKKINEIKDIDNKKIFILTHHPIDYYEENTKENILEFARKHNAFIFSGHSHLQAYEKQFRNNQVAHQFWCGNFQEKENASFNIVEIDYELDAFRLNVGRYYENKWNVEHLFSDKIKDFDSDILSFLMDIKRESDKILQFKMLWDKLFISPNLKFDDFWTDSSLLISKLSDIKLRKNIKHGMYSMSDCCLLYLLFQYIDNFRAAKIFRDIPINLNKLNWYEDNRYRRELLNTAAILLPDLFRFP